MWCTNYLRSYVIQSGAINLSSLNSYIRFSPADATTFIMPVCVNSCKVLSKKSVFTVVGRPNVWSYARFSLIDLFVKSEVFMVFVTLNFTVSHDNTPCNLVDRYETTRCHLPEVRILQIHTVHEDFVLNSSCTKLLFLSSSNVRLVLPYTFIII